MATVLEAPVGVPPRDSLQLRALHRRAAMVVDRLVSNRTVGSSRKTQEELSKGLENFSIEFGVSLADAKRIYDARCSAPMGAKPLIQALIS